MTGKTKNGVEIERLIGVPETRGKRIRILVANQSGARLFDKNGGEPVLIEVLDHPEGKTKGHDLVTERPGRSFDSHGGARHALTNEETPHEHVADRFAMFLADRLMLDRKTNRCDYILLVAEPRFLGNIFGRLDETTIKVCMHPLQYDFSNLSKSELIARLKETFAVKS
jgi:protein required for attachment to host cells